MSRRFAWMATPAAFAFAGALALGTGCVEQAEEKPTPEDLEFVKKNLLTTAPTPKFAVNADLDGKVTYLGLDVDPTPIEPGKDVRLIHYWKVNSALDDGWRAFTHLNGPNNQGYMNIDHGPVRGKYPVASWKAGDIVRDEHTIRLPPTWPHDKVMFYTGLWRRSERMAVRSGPEDGSRRVLAATVEVKGAAPPPIDRRAVVRKAAKPPKLDGVLDEAAWKDAPTLGVFVNTLTGAAGGVKTEAKLLWDDKNLYIAFENEDKDVWGKMKGRDDKLWQEEAVEVMIDPNGDGKSYVELQVSPHGTLFDTYLPTYRKYEDSIDPKAKPFSWNAKGLKAGVKVDGTIDQRDDQDKGWTVELAIPLSEINGLAKDGEGAAKVPPSFGDTWRLNLFRLDVAKDGKQEAVGWSPPLVGDFHALNRFGEITFADAQGQIPAAVAAKGDDKASADGSPDKKKLGAALKGLKDPAADGNREFKAADAVRKKSASAKKAAPAPQGAQ